MRVVAFERFGPPEVLGLQEWPDPVPGEGEVLVQVRAVSVGRLLDLGTRAGRNRYFKGTLPHLLGAEHAGRVAALGPGATGFQVGERVAAFTAVTCGRCRFCAAGQDDACPAMELIGVHRPGAYAEYTCVPARNLYRIPEQLSDTEAAALSLCGPVAWAQMEAAGVGPGSWVLIHAAASGLGSVAALVARHRGARVIGTSRQEWKRRRLLEIGLDGALDSYAPDFVARVHRLTGGEGVDVLVDNIGSAADWPNLIGALARRGTIVCSGAFLGETLPLDLRSFYQQSQRLLGLKTAPRAAVESFWLEVAMGLRPLIDRTFPLVDAAEAHRYLEQDLNLGRVVLLP